MSQRDKKSVTAAEAMARLQADPVWVKQQEEEERRRRERKAQFRTEQEDLLRDLRAVGTEVQSVWDLVNTSERYQKAIPVLFEHLRRPYSDMTRAGIARALAVPDARSGWNTLVDEYRQTPNDRENSKDALAVAVAATATPEVLDELISLLKDTSLGDSRLLLLRPLRRSKVPKAKQALEELALDPVFSTEIGSWKKRQNRQ